MKSANMAAVMALTISATNTAFQLPTGAPTPIGGLRPNGGKFGPFAIGARERSRLAWRSRVDAAARAAKPLAFAHALGVRTSQCPGCIALREHRAALAAPKPWRSPRKPDPRNHYPRSHRRACQRCKRVTYWVAEAKWARKCGRPEYRRFVNRELIWFRRNPHGRSDR